MNYIHDISGKQFCGFDDKPFLKVGKQKCGFTIKKRKYGTPLLPLLLSFLFCLASIEYRHE